MSEPISIKVGWFLLEQAVKRLPEIIKNKIDLPFWTIENHCAILELKNTNGSLATITKILELKPNYKGLSELVHRNIGADGSFCNFKFGLKDIPSDCISKMAGDYVIRERLTNNNDGQFDKDEIIKVGQLVKSILSYELKNSYPKSYETTNHFINYPTLDFKTEIHFPQNRPVKSVKMIKNIRTHPIEITDNKPSILDYGHLVVWEGRKLGVGETYTIEWEW